jgi:hypothetical protein
MKKIFANLMTALRTSSATQRAPEIETVDLSSIRYTMPTVAADAIEYVMPTKESFDGAPQFHEDAWRQLEFFPKARLGEIQQTLRELQAFEKANRTQYGWTTIFPRRVDRSLVIPGTPSALALALAFSASVKPAPILTTASQPLGQVKDGFSIELGPNAHLYGLSNGEGINVLAAHMQSGADNMLLSQAFSKLSQQYEVILADWRGQFILVSVATDGKIEVWHP